MINMLIILTYPFIVVSSILTSIVVFYSLIKTADQRSKLVLWWFLAGVLFVSMGLAMENAMFMYGRIYGHSIYDSLSDSTILYAIKLGYVFGMWTHFCAAWSAIRGKNVTVPLIVGGLIVWGFVYSILLFNFVMVADPT